MTESCLPSQMTGFNTYFLKVKVDIPYQKVIDYVNYFVLYSKTVSLISILCLCVGLLVIPPILAAHPCLIWCAVTQNQALTTL